MQTFRDILLKINEVSYSIDNKLILRNVNEEIKDIVGRGQIVALLGPSGSGKTTMFKLLSGLIAPTKGTIAIRVGDKYENPQQGIMGVVAQNYPLFDHLTVFENLCIVNTKNEVLKIVEHFKMSDHLSKFPCQLSGGQKQRIAIIQQVLCSESFILMDEPFSGLDPIAKCDVCRLIKETASHSEQNTIIVITHGIEEALKVADTIWMLGRDYGVEGSYIKHTINLIDRGLDMNCCSNKSPIFQSLINEITEKFLQL